VAVAAGLKTLELVQAPGFYDRLERATRALVEGVVAAAAARGVALSGKAVGGMFGLYFAAEAPQTYAQMMACDRDRFGAFFHAMLAEGVYLAPSAFEAGFVSAAHSVAEIEASVAAAGRCLGALR
jgi:glutamate-1-semialdehyde 2,1-aminomutase